VATSSRHGLIEGPRDLGFGAMRRSLGICTAFATAFCLLCAVAHVSAAEQTTPEQRTAQELDNVRSEPLLLRDFLFRMPKGADLHLHLTGATYAEQHIAAAAEDGLCVDPIAKSFTRSQPVHAGAEWQPVCEEGDVPASSVPANPSLYNALIDSFSMRGFVPSEGATGHDHFFEAFTKFGGTDPRHLGEWLDVVAARAARQNVQYLEVMATPTWNRLNTITKDIAWREDLGALRQELLAKGLTQDIEAGKQFWDAIDATRQEREHCGTASEAPACKVEVRYIYQVFRNAPKEVVFAAALFGFELASADPRVAGINLVGQEDAHSSMTDYAEHMRMIGFLRELYPHVHVSLHAGELTEGLVPPDWLCCHIRMAVEEANTDRIGHGTDIMYEDDPASLMKKMADKGILVEIALTSNDDVLGTREKNHPFPLYRKFAVPVALATDDEGIERIDLTNEYVRAVKDYGLTYADLKQIVRNNLEYGFLPGTSLWDGAAFQRVVPDCRSDALGGASPSATCAAFLKGSEKASQQWELERRFATFEAGRP
jgi:adenosine deaminase